MRKASRNKTAATGSGKTTKSAAKQTKSAPPVKTAEAKGHAPASSKAKAAEKSKPQPKKNAPTPTPAKAHAAKPVAKPATRPTPPPPKQPSRDEAAALKAFERAHREFTRGNFSEARALFRALIEQHAGVAEVTARARTYLSIAEARLRTETALPRDAEALYDRGVIELNRGDYVAAQEMFERAIKREPDSADSHYALAAARARLGSVEPALQSLGRAIELKPGLRLRAQYDTDLAPLRNEPEFERLVFNAARS